MEGGYTTTQNEFQLINSIFGFDHGRINHVAYVSVETGLLPNAINEGPTLKLNNEENEALLVIGISVSPVC